MAASLEELVQQVTAGASTPRQRAVAIHDCVRDTVKFGFNAWWDNSPPDTTLRAGYGHCNPKGALFVAMLGAAGIKARLHAVNIPADVLHGVLSNTPPKLTHTYTEVELDGQVLKTDSYIVDRPLFHAAQAKLKSEGRTAGYGVHAKGTCTWDGTNDAFAQFADPASMLLDDLRHVDSLHALVSHPAFMHRVGGLRIDQILLPVRAVAPRWFARTVNAPLNAMRSDPLLGG